MKPTAMGFLGVCCGWLGLSLAVLVDYFLEGWFWAIVTTLGFFAVGFFFSLMLQGMWENSEMPDISEKEGYDRRI